MCIISNLYFNVYIIFYIIYYMEDVANDNIINETIEDKNNNLIINNKFIGPYEIDDKFLIYSKELNEQLLTIKDINAEFILFDNKDIIFKLDENKNIILKNENYEIIEIYKVLPFDTNNLITESEIILTKDIYSEIIINIKELDESEMIYNDNDKKESMISSIIKSLNIYDNELEIKKVIESSYILNELINKTKNNTVFNNNFEIINNFKNILPKWLIPITDEKLILYDIDEEENNIDSEDIEKTFENKKFIEEQINILNKYDNALNYKEQINVLYNRNIYPLQKDNINDGYYMSYTGNYLRSCIKNSECLSFNKSYKIDYRKNNNNLIYYYLRDNSYNSEILGDLSKLNINGLLLLPDYVNIDLPFEIYNNTLNLYDKVNIINNFNNITIKQKINKLIECDNYNEIEINDNEIEKKNEYDSNKANEYLLKLDINNKELFNELLIKNIPDKKDIIDNYIYEDIYNNILNYKDIEKIFIKYNIKLEDLNIDNKTFFNSIIKKNVENYVKKYKTIYKEKIEIDYESNKKLDINKKISLIKDYIYKQLNENIKIYYLKKLIEKYTRESESLLEDNRWLYNKYNNEKLLCKHNCIYCKIKEDENAFENMLEQYGNKPVDGNIYCKVCNEFLSPENYTTFEGFDDDKPMFKEVLQNDKDDLEEIEPTEEEQSILKLINILAYTFNIKLVEYDILQIIEIYKIGYNLQLYYKRFNVYDEKSIIKFAKLYNMKPQDFIIYFNNTNQILLLYITIILYIQTAHPPYNIKNKLILVNVDNNKYKNNIKTAIYEKTITSILITLEKLANKYTSDNKWKQIKLFIDYDNDSIINNKEQIKNIIKYLLQVQKFSLIYNRINKYQEYNGFTKKLKLIEYWPIYRPLYTNNAILNINKIVNDSIEQNKNIIIKNNLTTYNIENISLLRSIESIITKPKYEELKINNLNLLINSAFIQLYNYIQISYGIQKDNLYINLLINRFLNTISNKEKYVELFKTYGWNKKFKDDEIDFKKLRKLLEINDYYKNKEYADTIHIFKHISYNTIDLLLLNSPDKRIYSYKNPVFFPEEDWNTIIKNHELRMKECIDNCKNNKKCIEKECTSETNIINYFNIFCFDITDTLIKKPKSVLYESLYFDIDSTYNPCDLNKSLEPNNENFKNMIKLNNIQNKLDKIYFNKFKEYTSDLIDNIEKPNLIEINLRNVISNLNKKIKDDNLEKLVDLLNEFIEDYKNTNNIKNINDKCPENFYEKYEEDFESKNECKYKNIITDILKSIENKYNSKLNKIINKFINNQFISEKFALEILNTFSDGTTTLTYIKSNIKTILTKLLDTIINNNNNKNSILNNDLLVYYINNIKLIIARIKNYNNDNCSFNNSITNYWKLTDNNKEIYRNFMGDKEFNLHNDIFINKKADIGFYKYFKSNYIGYFDDIFNDIYPYTQNLNILKSINISNFKNKLNNNINDISNIILKYIFISILDAFTNNLEPANDEEEEDETIFDDNDIQKYKIRSLLLKDILLNLFQEYNDPMWYIYINNKGVLNKKIEIQKEREKQSLIKKAINTCNCIIKLHFDYIDGLKNCVTNFSAHFFIPNKGLISKQIWLIVMYDVKKTCYCTFAVYTHICTVLVSLRVHQSVWYINCANIS